MFSLLLGKSLGKGVETEYGKGRAFSNLRNGLGGNRKAYWLVSAGITKE